MKVKRSFQKCEQRALLAFALSTLFGPAQISTASASGYQPNYIAETECQTDGLVEVCTINRHWGNYPRLLVKYSGNLSHEYPGKISAWIKLNGKSGLFEMTSSTFEEQIIIGDIRNLTRCSSDKMPEAYPICRSPASQISGWEYDPVPENEKKVLEYVRSLTGEANSWNIEVAFMAENAWDSKDGQNYIFKFE